MSRNKLVLDRMPFGGDYSPEQWPKDVWEEDLRMMKELGVNAVTINVHSWIISEPSNGNIDFTFLDSVIAMLKKADVQIIMGTGSTATPDWLYKEDKRTLRTDIKGRAKKHGVREMFCATSISYRFAVQRFVRALAKHYKNEKDIILWHLNNELSGFCYCETCERKFQKWLQAKYQTIENLNAQWCTPMWGRKYSSFEDIVVPSELNEVYIDAVGPGTQIDALPTEAIEYARFVSDMHKELFIMESQCIKEYIPHAVCTNNFQFRDRFNYHNIAQALDVISYDYYPSKNQEPHEYNFNLDISRNFITQDTPFILMEMTPNHASWSNVCAAKRPGEVGRIAMDAIAHGANSSLFFQIRRTPAGFEKFHGAMISHSGHLDTRIARELTAYAQDLAKFPMDLQTMGLGAKVAVIHDWDNKLGVEIPCTIRKGINYSKECAEYYRYFHDNNINVDVISIGQDYSRYAIVVAPMLSMIEESEAKRLEQYVAQGGILLLTYLSGYTNKCDYMHLNGQPGPLRPVAGLWVEEIDGLTDEEQNTMEFGDGTKFTVGFMCDVIRLETAEPLAVFGHYYYRGMPSFTKNTFGKGLCYYLGTKPESQGIDYVLSLLCKKAGISSILKTPRKVFAVQRGKYLFILNHGDEEHDIDLLIDRKNFFTEKIESVCTLGPQGYAVYHM